MTKVQDIVFAALSGLHKRNGVLSVDLDERVRPDFSVLFAMPADRGDVLRVKLEEYLERLMVGLSDEQELVARGTLNLGARPVLGSLTERMEVLAAELHVDRRTVRRRMNEAYRNMAIRAERGDAALTGDGYGGKGWYVDVFDVVLRLDRPTPEAIERRTIVVTAPSLERITTSVDVPRHPHADTAPRPELETEIVFGGLLAGRGRGSTTNFSLDIDLPRTMARGDRHTYELISRIPPGQAMAPRYVCVPYRSCRYFVLRVRFDPEHLPDAVWKHDGVPHSVVHDGYPAKELLQPDGAHEVVVEFRDLLNGCAYGVQWA
ncbi:hypothetical protein ACFFSW_21570 [Saccharothrix longispora]|uniref:Sigma-70-like protein n=1 Tax=Saccharothrix longispora TaxID=33920 RepID=A0ABU1Q6A1_9PSEU|nr:hypothetical protein [Saccharothrix longispora]MDR6598430.1 hypothetical protein [Saccharothrix longispora]